MKLIGWYKKRGLRFIIKRARLLMQRYGFRPTQVMKKISQCVRLLKENGCTPSFAVPGIVVEHNVPYFRELQDQGVELIVHGYNHVDMMAYCPEEASRQLERAVKVFRTNGLLTYGFRCPYLSASDDLLGAMPAALLEYSSNQAIDWHTEPDEENENCLLFDTLHKFYSPTKASAVLSIPQIKHQLLEIPVCVPDDLQLFDGLEYSIEKIAGIWAARLNLAYQQGVLLNLIFHPELLPLVEQPFVHLLNTAKALEPRVWITQLKDVCAWWKEKATFGADIVVGQSGVGFEFQCTPRATILARGLDGLVQGRPWHGPYQQLSTRSIKIEDPIRPYIGLAAETPPWAISALKDFGYIVAAGEAARTAAIHIDEAWLSKHNDPVKLIDSIECTDSPLIRYWPWPDGARSALCINGDLDALSIIDYARRLYKS